MRPFGELIYTRTHNVKVRGLPCIHTPLILKRGFEMGSKAEGAAQGYTLLGGIVLAIYAIQMLIAGINGAIGGDIDSLISVLLAIVLLLMVLLSFDACGFVYWKIRRSGMLLALFGLVSIFIIARGLSFDIMMLLTNTGGLAALMLLLAGLLLIFRK